MKINLSINIGKKHFYFLTVLVAVLFVFGVSASTYTNPANKVGHDANETGPGTFGQGNYGFLGNINITENLFFLNSQKGIFWSATQDNSKPHIDYSPTSGLWISSGAGSNKPINIEGELITQNITSENIIVGKENCQTIDPPPYQTQTNCICNGCKVGVTNCDVSDCDRSGSCSNTKCNQACDMYDPPPYEQCTTAPGTGNLTLGGISKDHWPTNTAVYCTPEVITTNTFTDWANCSSSERTIELFCMGKSLGWSGPTSVDDNAWRKLTNHYNSGGNEVDSNAAKIRCWYNGNYNLKACARCFT